MKKDLSSSFDNSAYPVEFLTLGIILLMLVKLFMEQITAVTCLNLSGTHLSQLCSDGFKTSNRK